jgi:hypothetical protein
LRAQHLTASKVSAQNILFTLEEKMMCSTLYSIKGFGTRSTYKTALTAQSAQRLTASKVLAQQSLEPLRGKAPETTLQAGQKNPCAQRLTASKLHDTFF